MFSEMWSKKRCKISDDKQGLRILTKINAAAAYGNSNVVIKPIFLPTQITKSTPYNHHCCYLKSCHLCHKPLPLDKEIYMYRGDLGFCSVECRDRQIYLDETKEIELSTKRIFSSFRRDGAGGRCETTSKLLKDFRRRRHPVSSSNNRVVFS